MSRRGVLIIFTRKPVAGETKTRLIPAIGATGAMHLQRRMLAHTLAAACRSCFPVIELHAYPDTNDPYLSQLSIQHGVSLQSQQGADLGARMFNALFAVLQKHDFAVLAGSDCPLLSQAILDRAYAWLQQQPGTAILGPCVDGGYYLIGVDRVEPELFQGMEWGTQQVAAQTRAVLDAGGWQRRELDELWDVDEPSDLARLQHIAGFSTSQ